MQKVIRMTGGLANRMFQFCYYLHLEKNNYQASVDFYKETKLPHENVDWCQIFPNAVIKQASSSLIFKYGGGRGFLNKVRRHYLPCLSNVWIGENATDIPTDEALKRNGYFIGVMQDATIAESVKETLLKCFKFSTFEGKSQNALLERKMRQENSVSVHLRKGDDYLQRIAYQNTCTIEYYQEAINLIKEKVRNPVFYIFTDNPNWVKENLIDFDYTLVCGNPIVGWGNHYDMQLMSCCKHNIIANSTYSWWGAFLNPNPDKIVVDPLYWYNPHIVKYRDRPNKTACKGWFLL